MGVEAVSFPFRRPSKNTIKSHTWFYRVLSGDEQQVPKPLGSSIESWDYNVNLGFTRTIEIDSSSLLDQCGLQDGANLAIIVLVSTSGQRVRRTALRADLECLAEAGIDERTLGFSLDGETLQGDLRIDTEICVAQAYPKHSNDMIAPVAPGSRIWADSVTVDLEGSLSRFPMSSVSFKKSFGDIGDAAWMLSWSPDAIESSAASVVRLYLNSDCGLFNEISACNTAICNVVQTDVLRQVLVTLLADPDFDLSPDSWPQHSLGNLAAGWAMDIFGEVPADHLRSRACSDPGWIEACIQSYLGLGNAG